MLMFWKWKARALVAEMRVEELKRDLQESQSASGYWRRELVRLQNESKPPDLSDLMLRPAVKTLYAEAKAAPRNQVYIPDHRPGVVDVGVGEADPAPTRLAGM